MPYSVLDPSLAAVAPATTIGVPVQDNGLTFRQLQDELRARLLGRVDIVPERFQLYINLAYTDLATSIRSDELVGSISYALTSGQYLYMLPKDIVYAIQTVSVQLPTNVFYEPGYPLEKTSLEAWRSRIVKEDWPKEYFKYLGMLVLWPEVEAAGGTLVVDFRVRPKFLVQEDDCPILGAEWHEGILILAEQKTLEAVKEWEAAGIAENAYVKFMRKRLNSETLEEETKVMRSSVPRDEATLRRRRRLPGYYDAVD